MLEHLGPELVLPAQILEPSQSVLRDAILEDDDRGQHLYVQFLHEERRLLRVEMKKLAAAMLGRDDL